ncbi:MAG: hypothetical protein ABWZ91_15915 [Nocardioides sp.]|jgi:hypothetical protein
MSTTPRSEADRVATYEISLRGKVPESLGSHSTGMSVRSAPTQTVLFRSVRDVGELDTLLERLRSSGLVLLDIHGTPQPGRRTSARRYYEVRVRGELGPHLLEYLGWSHRLITERQVARGEVSARDLDAFLAECAEAGLVVDQVRRTGP